MKLNGYPIHSLVYIYVYNNSKYNANKKYLIYFTKKQTLKNIYIYIVLFIVYQKIVFWKILKWFFYLFIYIYIYINI